MSEANYCSRSLMLHTINPCAPVFEGRTLTQVRGEHLGIERGRLMTRRVREVCTDKCKGRALLVDEDPELDRLPDTDAELHWERHVGLDADAFPRTLALYHPLRRSPIASMRLAPLAPRGRENALMHGGLLVREPPLETLVDFAQTEIAQKIRRTASLIDRRGGFLLSLERFVGHLGDRTLNATALLQALVKLVVDAPRRVEGLITPLPRDSSFVRLFGELEQAELAPVRHLGNVSARLLRFTKDGVLKDTRIVDLHVLHIDVLHMRHTLSLLDEFQPGSPERRLLDTSILTRGFLKNHLASAHQAIAPELDRILSTAWRSGGDESPGRHSPRA